MTDKDWNPDDLLDFHYDHPAPRQEEKHSHDFDIFDEFDAMQSKRATSHAEKPAAKPVEKAAEKSGRGLDASFDSYDEFKRYEKAKQQRHEVPAKEPSAESFDALIRDYANKYDRNVERKPKSEPVIEPVIEHKYDPKYEAVPEPKVEDKYDESIFAEYDKAHGISHDLVEEKEQDKPMPSVKELEKLRQASKEAHERYRSNYTKGREKREGRQPVSKGHKFLTMIYIIALAAFAGSMTIMNVLPFEMLIALYVVLALISLLILVQTRRSSIKKWGRRLATFLAVILIGVYGVGTAYALGTLSFLSETSVDENSKAVANITKEPFNVVITGMDVRGKIGKQGRSDVNMVLTVNPETATVLMTSIPRDYEIYMPNYDNEMDKLTHTGFYSVDTTILAEEQLLDITANYYVKVNFSTVEKFIDAIGGVDVYSEYEFNPVKMKEWTVKEGMNHMNGKQALAFARERKAFATGDNQRIKNQQAVFEAMFKKATSSRTMVFNYNKILTNLKPYFEMSFSAKEIRQLAKMQLARFPDWGIYKNTITGGDGNLNTYTAGYAYVMTQDPDSINNAKALINAVLSGQAIAKDDDGVAYIPGE